MEDLVQRPDNAVATLSLDVDDQRFLTDTLPQLPTDDELHHPVTIDLNGHIALRAKAADKETTTELVLVKSRYSGTPIRINTNRDFVRRAVRLGFSNLSIYGNSQPIQCHDGRRTYIWLILDASGAYAPSADGVQIASSANSPPTVTSLPNPQPKNRITMIAKAYSRPNSDVTGKSDTKAEVEATTEARSPIENAVALRDSLRTTLDRTNELIRSLKRQRQQSRLVQATLNSLRQLQTVAK